MMNRNAGNPTRKSSRRAAGRGALRVVALLLLGSAALRVGAGVDQAVARTHEEPAIAALDPAPFAQECRTTGDLQRIMDAFDQREQRLEQRETAVQDRLQALRIADREVTLKLAQLEQAEAALSDTIVLAETASESDISRLTKVYENMKPKQAAALFEEMEPEFAAGFLGRMNPNAAAAIMAGLSPQAAHGFSVVLAGRNAGVPTE